MNESEIKVWAFTFLSQQPDYDNNETRLAEMVGGDWQDPSKKGLLVNLLLRAAETGHREEARFILRNYPVGVYDFETREGDIIKSALFDAQTKPSL